MYQIFFEILLLALNFYGKNSLNEIAKSKIIIQQNIKNRNWISAENKLKSLISKSIDEPEIISNLGFVLLQQGKLAEAEKFYKQINNSTNINVAVEAEFQLSFIHYLKKDTAQAISNLENTLRKDAKHDLARQNLQILKNLYSAKVLNKDRLTSQVAMSQLDNTSFKQNLDPKSEKEAELERIKKINLSELQIENIFEALASSEKKYLQKRQIKVDSKLGNFQTW